MRLYRLFLFVLGLLNFKAWGKEKVWVNAKLIGYGESQYLPVGSLLFDSKGRQCEVVKMGKIGALKRISKKDTEDTVAGWSFKRLGWVYYKYIQSRHFVLKRALMLGPSLKFRYMTLKFKTVIWMFRLKTYIRHPVMAWKYKINILTGRVVERRRPIHWNLDNIVLWWFIVAPLTVGILLSLGGVL